MGIKYNNFARSALAVGLTSVDTTLSVVGTQGERFPVLGAGDYFYAVLQNSVLQREIVKVTARAGDTFTVVRGQDGTTAQAWVANDSFSLRFVAAAITDTLGESVQRTSATGAAVMPSGTTAQRDVAPSFGYARANITLTRMEWWNGTAWTPMGGGASGGGSDAAFYENDTMITQSRTIGEGAMNACTISIASPAVITQANDFVAGQPVRFTTDGTLPTGLDANSQYFVVAAGLTTASFRVSATAGGTAVNTTGAQSGTHKCGKIKNAQTTGPVTIADGVVITVPTGSTWTIV